MFRRSTSSFFFQSLGLLLLISQTLAQQADHRDHSQTQKPCRSDTDCGPGATCERDFCKCSIKDQVYIPEADTHCQTIGTINGNCKYNQQCTAREVLSRCENSKCQCYDTRHGRDVVKEYRGSCYPATALDEPCMDRNQCRAFITPEEHVDCKHNATLNQIVCQCDDGYKCEHKNNAQSSAQVNYFVTFALVGLMAVKTMV